MPPLSIKYIVGTPGQNERLRTTRCESGTIYDKAIIIRIHVLGLI